MIIDERYQSEDEVTYSAILSDEELESFDEYIPSLSRYEDLKDSECSSVLIVARPGIEGLYDYIRVSSLLITLALQLELNHETTKTKTETRILLADAEDVDRFMESIRILRDTKYELA